MRRPQKSLEIAKKYGSLRSGLAMAEVGNASLFHFYKHRAKGAAETIATAHRPHKKERQYKSFSKGPTPGPVPITAAAIETFELFPGHVLHLSRGREEGLRS
jgi:hypothetical protein